MMAELKKFRRQISLRLAKARKEGRELQELRAIEREGDSAFREAVNGRRNGHNGHRPKK